ncbi:TAXI family TRAP transporter solute-binding subunit [Lachnospiraceae bacterium 62-35]
MKKRFTAGLCIAAMSMTLCACGGNASPSNTETAAANSQEQESGGQENPMVANEPITLRFASSGSGGSDYTDIGTIITFLSEDGILPAGSVLTQETISGGTSTSGYLIEAGQADICRGQNAFSATVGFNGRDPYSKVRALFGAGGNSVCLQVSSDAFTKKSGYSTIEEIIENKYPARICSEDVGSSDYVLLNYIFEIYGIDAETFESWGGSITYTGNDTASEMMQDGSCDLICMASTLTSATVTELSMSTDVKISGFNDKIVDGLLERGFAERYIPSGTFDQFPGDARTAYLGTSIIVSEEMDERVAYTLTKIMVENREKLAETCPTFKGMTLEGAVDMDITVVPLHEGAVKYFQDIGVLDEEGKPAA